MNIPTAPETSGTATRPYLIRALHDWCTDNGFTPYLAVYVDSTVQVPMEYVKNNEIVLNVGFEATSGLKLGNEFVEFKARFGGAARDIAVPVDHVVAIYARENGQGMAFPAPVDAAAGAETGAAGASKGVTPLRGLRLARSETDTAASGRDKSSDAATDKLPDGPPEPPAPLGPRPSLKRVK